MTTYADLLKKLAQEPPKKFDLILPRPVDKIFPDTTSPTTESAQLDLLKKSYYGLVSAAFSGQI